MPAVASTENSVITAIVSGSPDRARRLADFHGVEHVVPYEGYDALLAADIVDAVYIALPNSLHADYTLRAARAGRHLLVEKPLAPSIGECEAMIAAAEEHGVHLMTAYRLHTEPGTLSVLDRIRQGEIGEPRLFTAAFGFVIAGGNHRLRAEHWGGPLQDIGIYCLNAARHVFADEPIEVMAMSGRSDGNPCFTEVEECVAATLRFPGDRLAQFSVTFGAGKLDSYTVIGTDGCLTLHPGFQLETGTRLTRRMDGEFSTTEFADVDQFAGLAAYFSDCVLNDTPPAPDGREGLADVRALLAIEEAARTGRPQPVRSSRRPCALTPDMARTLPRTDHRLLLP